MLLPGEWIHLHSAAIAGPVRLGMPGDERAILYQTAIETGLRANELRHLTRPHLMLDAKAPYVRAKAATTKNRKEAQQFISKDLVRLLRYHVANKLPNAPVFDLPDPTDMAAMIREDLAVARRTWLRESIGNLDSILVANRVISLRRRIILVRS